MACTVQSAVSCPTPKHYYIADLHGSGLSNNALDPILRKGKEHTPTWMLAPKGSHIVGYRVDSKGEPNRMRTEMWNVLARGKHALGFTCKNRMSGMELGRTSPLL